MEEKKAKKVNSAIPTVKIQIGKPIDLTLGGVSSFEMKRNSKGNAEFSVKIYDEDPEKAFSTAKKIYDKANKEFPFTG